MYALVSSCINTRKAVQLLQLARVSGPLQLRPRPRNPRITSSLRVTSVCSSSAPVASPSPRPPFSLLSFFRALTLTFLRTTIGALSCLFNESGNLLFTFFNMYISLGAINNATRKSLTAFRSKAVALNMNASVVFVSSTPGCYSQLVLRRGPTVRWNIGFAILVLVASFMRSPPLCLGWLVPPSGVSNGVL